MNILKWLLRPAPPGGEECGAMYTCCNCHNHHKMAYYVLITVRFLPSRSVSSKTPNRSFVISQHPVESSPGLCGDRKHLWCDQAPGDREHHQKLT